jgi:hypothetical protein
VSNCNRAGHLAERHAAERQGGLVEIPAAIFRKGLHAANGGAGCWWTALGVSAATPCRLNDCRRSSEGSAIRSINDKMESIVNDTLTVEQQLQQLEALKQQLLAPLKQERKSLQDKLAKIEKKMTKIDPKSVDDGGIPSRIDYASHALLQEAEDGMSLLELQNALKDHKAKDKLEASLEKDAKVELREGKYFLKAV